MKPMKFFKSPFPEKHFQTSKESAQSSNILIFVIFYTFYNKWHQSINCSSIEILIKINLEKSLKIKLPGHFFEKVDLTNFFELISWASS